MIEGTTHDEESAILSFLDGVVGPIVEHDRPSWLPVRHVVLDATISKLSSTVC